MSDASHGRSDREVFDAHLHIIDPRFPLIPNKGYLPDPFTVEPMLDYTRANLEPYEKCGSCGSARKVHQDGSGPNLWEYESCGAFELSGKTLGGDELSEWEYD